MEGLPGFVKPMVLHGMKRSLPEPEHARFAPIFTDEKVLKALVAFDQPEFAYLVVATSEGKVVWTSHHPATKAEFKNLQKAVSPLLSK